MNITNCLICGHEISSYPSRQRKTCGMDCKSIYQSRKMSGKNNPAYKGGTSVYSNGKKRATSYSQRYIIGGIKKPEHRHIVEMVLGRLLVRSESVHHINGDSMDNRRGNLLLCSTVYHIWIHNNMSRLYMKEHFCLDGWHPTGKPAIPPRG